MKTAEINIYIGNESKDIVSLMKKKQQQKKNSVRITEKEGKISIYIESKDTPALMSSIESIGRQMRLLGQIESFANNAKI
jgi:tRNA threonylcarbamoyladenosine modification (KEOPS) complex  Pcc1 subunit